MTPKMQETVYKRCPTNSDDQSGIRVKFAGALKTGRLQNVRCLEPFRNRPSSKLFYTHLVLQMAADDFQRI